MNIIRIFFIIIAINASLPLNGNQESHGYTDTPLIPGTKWRVHDANRPHPEKVKPGTESSQEKPGKAPSDAIILFDGTNLEQWANKKWTVRDGYMEVKPAPKKERKNNQQISKASFGDMQLHIEWSAPNGKGQNGSNSGIFLMGIYEVQIMDSYENVTYADGQAAAIYGQYPPLVNASRKPREWQSYDLFFTAPRFKKNGKLKTPAYLTLVHNGVLVHNHVKLLGATKHKKTTSYKKHSPEGPIVLQDHGDLVRYRNIWVREL